jgi:hypothetical protein
MRVPCAQVVKVDELVRLLLLGLRVSNAAKELLSPQAVDERAVKDLFMRMKCGTQQQPLSRQRVPSDQCGRIDSMPFATASSAELGISYQSPSRCLAGTVQPCP